MGFSSCFGWGFQIRPTSVIFPIVIIIIHHYVLYFDIWRFSHRRYTVWNQNENRKKIQVDGLSVHDSWWLFLVQW